MPSNNQVDEVLAADQSSVSGKKEELIGVTPSVKPPSTGNRPTVIDAAPSFSESDDIKHVKQLIEPPEPEALDQSNSSPGQMEKLRSSHDRYPSIVLPSIEEEVTQAPTHLAIVSRKNAPFELHDAGLGKTKAQPISETSGILSLAISQVSDNNPPSKQVPFLPNVDFDSLLKYNSRHHYDPGTTTVSVEVMSITGTTALPLTRDQAIFYDTELLAIVHQSKSQSSGLVSTSVWGWEGRRAVLGPREQRKLQEIAQIYSTSVVSSIYS
ncbi:hypothetical protein C0993_000694 [Termitomyces sp. T159_Od127]|nr:hypothetical protein C0993_000694 [Termitomyces sp. T159_Od127]